MKTTIIIPEKILPKVRATAKKENISLAEAFVLLMRYNTPCKKNKE